MKQLRVRLVGLEVSVSRRGIEYRAFVLCGGKATPVRGFCASGQDLAGALMQELASVYLSVTGEVLPDESAP